MIALETGVTARFAAFVRGPLTLPPDVATMGKRMIANALALAIGSANDPTVTIARAFVRELGTRPEATVLGCEERVAPTWAAFVNGIAIHVEDYDDTHLPTVLHPGAPIVAAALAAGELVRTSGRAVLEAVVVGTELAMRVGNALCPSHFDRGWHVTGTMGHLGAAAAAARILRLDVTQTRNALGIAALEAAGLTSANGTMTKSFHPGKAAFDGVEAALLAQRGITAAPRAFEGRRGLGVLMSAHPDWETALDGLGERWETPSNAFKPYACGVVSHPVIDAAIALRDRFASAEAIVHVVVRCHPVVLDVMGKTTPRNGLESKFSAYHCLAVGFLDGAAGPRQFSDARAVAPDAVALRDRVTVETTLDVPKGAAILTAVGRNGDAVAIDVPFATGSSERPMTAEQLEAKAVLVAGDGIRPALALIAELEGVAHIETLLAALPKAPPDA